LIQRSWNDDDPVELELVDNRLSGGENEPGDMGPVVHLYTESIEWIVADGVRMVHKGWIDPDANIVLEDLGCGFPSQVLSDVNHCPVVGIVQAILVHVHSENAHSIHGVLANPEMVVWAFDEVHLPKVRLGLIRARHKRPILECSIEKRWGRIPVPVFLRVGTEYDAHADNDGERRREFPQPSLATHAEVLSL